MEKHSNEENSDEEDSSKEKKNIFYIYKKWWVKFSKSTKKNSEKKHVKDFKSLWKRKRKKAKKLFYFSEIDFAVILFLLFSSVFYMNRMPSSLNSYWNLSDFYNCQSSAGVKD